MLDVAGLITKWLAWRSPAIRRGAG